MKFMISIVIPIYNVEPYILECLQSVVNQKNPYDIECILVDDCGTDNSVLLAEDFIKSYKGLVHFTLIHHKKNGGLSAARNTGIRNSHGEYLYFLDSDDTIKNNCIELLLGLAQKHNAELVVGSYDTGDSRMSQFDRIDYPEYVDNKRNVKRMLLNYDILPVTAANRLIRRELIIQNDLFFKEGIIHEDNYWTFFLAKHINRMAICKEKIYNYRLTLGSITNKVNVEKETFAFKTMITDFCNNIDRFEKGAQKRDIFCLLLNAINSHYYKDNNERTQLLSCFQEQNGLFINCLLKFVFKAKKNTFIRNKSINLLMKIFESNSWLCQ